MEIILIFIGTFALGLVSLHFLPNDPEPRRRVELPKALRND